MENPNKGAFYNLLLWVHKNHPKTLALNVRVFEALGLLEDLLKILKRVLDDSIISNDRSNGSGCDHDEKKTEAVVEEAPTIDISKARIAIERYQNDPDYRFLHDQISDLFAEVLTSDLKFLASGAIKSISFASKFCPSIDSPQDYETLICESIAKKMFPRNNHIEYKDVEEPYYTYRVRYRLGDHVLIPLREAIEIVKKPSIKTENSLIVLEAYRKIFKSESKEGSSIVLFHHCMEIIELFSPIENVVDTFGKLSIGNGSTKLPHQIVASLF
ncbi:uncharacterized protein LOC126782446 [Argentina anserina]|uniref:uncharacterized protein LOC126782446 n=1 Tax=Argentina anserina TaxID=57926 RepID=UPI00217640C0|nr:uncharacterized protein LOC126782446 [Potentilla anserina]